MCLSGASCQTSQEPSPGNDLPVVVGAIVVAIVVAIILIITLVIVIIVFQHKRETKFTFSAREGSNDSASQSSQNQSPALEGYKGHNFENPIYGEGSTPAGSDKLKGEIILTASGTSNGHKGANGSQDDDKIEVINPGYHKFREASDKSGEAKISVNTQILDCMYASVGQTLHKVIPGEDDGAAVPQHNEYDAIVRHELSNSAPTSSAATAAGIVPPVYSEVGGETPREGEVYNVAYPVLTPKEGETEVVDGYACLSSVHLQ